MAGSAANVDADLAETTWCCYAWPVNYGNSGNRMFLANQAGDVLGTEEPAYTGPNHVAGGHVETGAAYVNPPDPNTMTGQLAVNAVGGDGNVWRPVN